jgi:hypothetical protein
LEVILKEERRKKYEKFFNSQKEIFSTLLHQRGPDFGLKSIVIEEMISEFEALRENVIKKALNMDIPDGSTPFVFVLPKRVFGLIGLLSLIKYKKLKGMLDFNPEKIFRLESKNLHNIYVIYDVRVDNDKELIGKSFRESSLYLKSNNRFLLTDEELLSFCFFNSKWLNGYYNMGCATFFIDDDCNKALCLYLRGKEENSKLGIIKKFNLSLVGLDEKDDYLVFPSYGNAEIGFL